MIAKLKGKIDYIEDSSIIINTDSGIGYQVFIFNPQKYNLCEEIELYLFHKQSEKEDSLWGFDSLSELKLTKILMSVNGIGVKIAQSLVSNFDPAFVAESIINGNFRALSMPGVGPKTSQKIVNELNNKDLIHNFIKKFTNSSSKQKKLIGNTNLDEAIGALESLGFLFKDINNKIKQIEGQYDFENLKTQEIIKLLLKYLNNK